MVELDVKTTKTIESITLTLTPQEFAFLFASLSMAGMNDLTNEFQQTLNDPVREKIYSYKPPVILGEHFSLYDKLKREFGNGLKESV